MLNYMLKQLALSIGGLVFLFSIIVGDAHGGQKIVRQSMVDWMVNKSTHKVDIQLAHEIAVNITKQSRLKNIDPFLLLSLIKNESGFRTGVKSAYGAKGLMQVVPHWHKDKIGKRSITSVSTNIEVGTQVLSDCLDKQKGNIRKALHCYSGGASSYTEKLHKTYIEIRKHNTKFVFENELPHTVNSSFHKPRGFKTESLDVLIATL